jgi:sulfite reductase (NADPH) hemoprotein beta-component
MIAKTLRGFLPKRQLLAYLEATLRVYNEFGRRDNLFKSRIKILVQSLGIEKMREAVEAEFAAMDESPLELPAETIAAIAAHFAPPPYAAAAAEDEVVLEEARAGDPAFARWLERNVTKHRVEGYAIATVSLKPPGRPPGDVTAEQMERLAELAEIFSLGEIRVTHEQNLVLPHVRRGDLPELWWRLRAADLGHANAGLASDIIACPGLDYCSLANARSIPVAQDLSRHLAARDHEIGELRIKISGCINACGHHHVGHIGILGVDKNGEEFYQITIGGSADENAALGAIIGPAVAAGAVTDAVDKLIDVYVRHRRGGERFPETYRRVGAAPFKEALYASA